MRMFRRSSVQLALLFLSLFSVIFYVYYAKFYLTPTGGSGLDDGLVRADVDAGSATSAPGAVAAALAQPSDPEWDWSSSNLTGLDSSWMKDSPAKCPVLQRTKVDIDTLEMYSTLNFNPRYKEYWNENFERRYQKRRENWHKLPLKVIIIPHSHNDPGWLKTFEGYFHSQTSNILNNMVDKLFRYPNMTFVWSETSFLAKWWKGAHHQKREALKELLVSGRLELLAGGWVMTDEANVQLYSMVDQMIEGHQWIKHHLNYTPKNSWSIDPFGHGSTMPYLLRLAGFEGTTVQRIHHGWKERLAELQSSDFRWRQPWDVEGSTDILCHNFPFDIYNIKHSCGPHTQVCLTFDFRKVRGEFTEYTQRAQPITQWNVREKAEILLAQYGRTGSLFPHNVALVLLGDDFRYDHAIEWDQQFANYNLLINHINAHPEYHAHVQFGTLATYFDAVRRRMATAATPATSVGGGRQRDRGFPVLSGDFFVYSDVFNDGRPAYWSGFFTTRPFYKALARELEATARATEIVYTLALARARQQGLNRTIQILERDYQRLMTARQRLGDFQHHDAITGTSKTFVMNDFGVKLYDGIQAATSALTHAVQYLLTARPHAAETRYESLSRHWPNFLFPPQDRANFHALPRQLPLAVSPDADVQLVLVNTLAHFRHELVRVVVKDRNVRVLDAARGPVPFQFGPVWNYSAAPFQPVPGEVELAFVADLPPLSIVVFTLQWSAVSDDSATAVTTIYNAGGRADDFPSDLPAPVRWDQKAPSRLDLENDILRLEFDPGTGLLAAVVSKRSGLRTSVNLQFQAYASAQFHSGAYLFMPEPRQPIVNVSDNAPYYGVVRGPVYSEVVIVYPNFLRHTVRLYHDCSGGGKFPNLLCEGAFMENLVDYPPPPHFRETELFVRLATDVDSGDDFFTDENCFQLQRRRRLPSLGPEANYYPLTCMMHIEDARRRLTLLVSHAHGGSSLQSGWMEVMLERRSMYDDSRGLAEGVVDNRPTLSHFWLLPEDRNRKSGGATGEGVPRATLLARHLSNALSYPPTLFAVDARTSPPQLTSKVYLLGRPFPCDVHLVNWRVLPVDSYFKFPSRHSLLLLHRQGHSCDFGRTSSDLRCPLTDGRLSAKHRPRHVRIASIRRTSLTALTTGDYVDSLGQVSIRPMEISSWDVKFV